MSVVAADIEQAIGQLLLGSPVAALVQNRIRPLNAATTDVRPLVTYQAVSAETFDHMKGSASWERRTIQIDVFADVYATARQILAACKIAMHNFSGEVGNVTIGVMRRKEDVDLTEPPDLGQEQPIIRLQSNYVCVFSED